jgi:hypothetical protein
MATVDVATSGDPMMATNRASWTPPRSYELEAEYLYFDAAGGLVSSKGRFRPIPGARGEVRSKTFLQRWPDDEAQGGWVYKKPDGALDVPYRLPELVVEVERGGTVWWPEGEKDVDCLAALGLCATTSVTTSKLPDGLEEVLRGAQRVYVLPDNDEPGRRYAEQVADVAAGTVLDVRIVPLPELPERGDVSDFLASGHDVDELWRHAEAAPSWLPGDLPTNAPSPSPKIGPEPDQKDANALLRTLRDMADDGSLELFHDPAGEAFCTTRLPYFPSTLTMPVRGGNGEQFSDLLRAIHKLCCNPRTFLRMPTIKELAEQCAADARTEGVCREVSLRVARIEEDVWIDIGDETGRAIHVTEEEWRVCSTADVRFRRSKGMLPLPIPMQEGSGELLSDFLNVSLEQHPLIYAWLLAALSGTVGYPALGLSGEQGSSKTMMAEFVRQLVDPVAMLLRGPAKDEEALALCARNNFVLGFDNLSRLSPAVSDAMCRTVYGQGFATRAHYTNTEEVTFKGARPMIWTGIDELPTRADLLDRSFLVQALPISKKRDEHELKASFEASRPSILGWLLNGVAAGLAHHQSIEVEGDVRLIDACKFAIAAERGLGLPEGTMRRGLEAARDSSSAAALESSPVAGPLVAWLRTLDSPEVEATASEILHALQGRLGDQKTPRDFPTHRKAMGNELRRAVPALRSIGVELTPPIGPSGHTKRRLFRIRLLGEGEVDRGAKQ